MIEFNKIFCDLHPNELVSNYCSHEQCNIGLCATCICSHTETHIQRHTTPNYQNIRSTYSIMQDNLRTRISALEHQKSRINLLIENIHQKRTHISELVVQARHETLDFVNRFYDAKEKEIHRKMEADQKKLGLHNEHRMETLGNMVSRDVNSLFAAAQDLNSQNFLENFNRIRTQVLANSLQTQKEISEELDRNEHYEVTLNINPIFINDIKSGLEKSLTLIWDQKALAPPTPTPPPASTPKESTDVRENYNRSSRLMVSPNSNSEISYQKRSSESMPKPAYVNNHPSRCTSTVIPSYFLKPNPTPVQYQPQPQQQPHYQQPQQPQHSQQAYSFRPEPYMANTSMPVQQVKPNISSRMDLRVNSSQKNIKDQNKHPLAKSYMQSSFSHLSTPTPQLQASKKIRRSGLTVLRSVDNEKN